MSDSKHTYMLFLAKNRIGTHSGVFLGGEVLLCATCMFESHKHCLCSDTALKGGAGGVLLFGPLIDGHIYGV